MKLTTGTRCLCRGGWDLPGRLAELIETMHPEKCERLVQSSRPGVGLRIIRKVHG
jgi:hypothetical protein